MNLEYHKIRRAIPLLICSIIALSGCHTFENGRNDKFGFITAKEKYQLGLHQMENRKYHEAISSFQAAIQANNKHIMAHTRLGWAYYSLMDFVKAKEQWEEAIALDPKSTEAHLGIGYLHFMDHQYGAAVQSFKAAISGDPTESAAHAAIGRVYHKMGLVDKATVELEISIDLNPNEIMSYWALGEIYEEKGMSEKAKYYKGRAISTGEALRKKREIERTC